MKLVSLILVSLLIFDIPAQDDSSGALKKIVCAEDTDLKIVDVDKILNPGSIPTDILMDEGGWGSGGGDPIEVEVKKFPNPIVLKEAINLLVQKVSESPFTQNFKDAFIKDLRLIQSRDFFFYIPKLFAVGFNRFGGDYNKLVSNGAMTEFTSGGAIFFSKQAENYDARTLARVIAQEIPHHIFKGRFQRNEVFANNLGTYLITQGEIPNEPYPAAQIIYEEFDKELRDDASLKIIKKVNEKLQSGENVLKTLYFMAHELYKIRGSYHHYHVEFALMEYNELKSRFPKYADITKTEKLLKTSLETCVFTPYEDGASGVTKASSQKLARTFMETLDLVKDEVNRIFLVENFYLPATKVVTDCGVGVETKDGKTYVFKSIFRHEGNQHGPPPMPPTGNQN